MPLSDTRQPRLRLRKRGAGRGNKRDAAPAPPPAARWFKPQFHDARLRQCSGTRDVGVGQPTSRREDLQRVQIGSVALEDSVGQEYEPVAGLQLELLDVIFGIDRDPKREARSQIHILGMAVTDQDRQGMAGVHDSCDTRGMIDPYDLPGHEVAIN